MQKSIKRTISILLSILMIVGVCAIVPITASAETTGTVYDSGEHDASELNTGDYIVSGIGSLMDESCEYTITLKAGTYTDWPGGDSAYDEDYTIEEAGLFEISTDAGNVLCFSDWMEDDYMPFVDGKIANAFYVESADHEAKTITLAGANYSAEEPVTYTVTWKNWDGSDLEVDTEVEKDTLPTYDGEVPTKDEDESNTYTFSGWNDGNTTYGLSDTLPAVSGDVTYTATFTAVPKPVELPDVIKDCTYEFPPQYNYAIYANVPFATQSFEELLTGAILFDRYIGDTMHYSYTFYDQNGTDITPALINSSATPGAALGLSDDVTLYVYDYGFGSSMPNPLYIVATAPAPEVIKDCTYQKPDSNVFANVPFKPDDASDYSSLLDGAIYVSFSSQSGMIGLADAKEYSYKFYDQTGTEIAATLSNSSEVPGSQAGLSDDVTFYVKTFTLTIPDNLDKFYIVATAPEAPSTFTVTWKNWDGSVLETDENVAVDSTPSYDGTTPAKADDAQNTYAFAAWDDGTTTYLLGVDNLPAVTGDVTYTAVFTAETKVPSGLTFDADGEIRYYVDGVPQYQGLVKDNEGNYYYINSTKKAVKNCDYSISEAKANGLKPAGKYSFGADGKMIIKSLLTFDADGEIRYYIDSVPQYQGLVKDTDGSYYYINSTKKAVRNCDYSISEAKANGLKPAGKYTFGADGKMIIKSMLTFDADGEIRYYVDSVPQYQGLVQDTDGSYYYINSTKKAVKNCEYSISEAKANGLMPAGKYTFGADGKMVN